ncbi:transcriptional regulator [Dryocola sp. LX212]|jgi:predicted transcriptional regulator
MKAHIGILSEELQRKRILAGVSGKYKTMPDEPKIWFCSFSSLGKVLSPENLALLQTMKNNQPESIEKLAELSGRELPQLLIVLGRLNGLGFVELERQGKNVKPKALFTDFVIHVDSTLEARINAA